MGVLHHLQSSVSQTSYSTIFLALGALLSCYVTGSAIYNLFFHPLRSYPGPKLYAISNIPHQIDAVSGQSARVMLAIHKKYGPVVRVGPNSLAYCHPDAVKQIRGHRKAGAPEHGKDPVAHFFALNDIVGANREDHARYRRSLANGFSLQSMIGQQPLILHHIDKMILKLKERSEDGTRKINLLSWLNFAAFDIISDLSFGESFHCLDAGEYDPWIKTFKHHRTRSLYIGALGRIGQGAKLLQRLFISKTVMEGVVKNHAITARTVQQRLEKECDRPDFLACMSAKKGTKDELTLEQITAQARILVAAGSDTTSTAVAGAVFYLARNPEVAAKLYAELRSQFQSEAEMGIVSTQNLTYLNAVLEESLRLYPPAIGPSPRKIAEGGDWVIDRYVPEGTIAEVWQYALFHNPAYFKDAEEFHPERWLEDPRYASDVKAVFEPFSTGPRNCIGKNLAYAEMRILLSRLVWSFELELASESANWDAQGKIFATWSNAELNLFLKPRTEAA